MSDLDDSFLQRLQRGPAYLFLGQRWLADSGRSDPLLQQTLTKFGVESTRSGYSALFDTAVTERGAVLEWMSGRSPNIPTSERIEVIANFPWNGVFTSAIDDVLVNLFRNPKRDVQRVLSLEYQPTDSRSRAKMHLWHLFGNVSAPDEYGRPPLDPLGLIKRKGVATQMIAHLRELVTSLGVLCIYGYNPGDDWLDFDLFYLLASSFEPGQVHWFGVDGVRHDQPLIQALLDSGQLTLHPSTLAHTIVSAERSGFLPIENVAEDAWARRIRFNKRVLAVPDDLFRQTTTTARLISEEVFAPQRSLDSDAKYAAFRNFLYDSSHSPAWEGYAQRFAFRREFQTSLETMVQRQLSNRASRARGEPIIVHGATGCGKTVALGQLAFDVQQQGVYPVLFVDRGTRLRSESLDRFCQWAETAGSTVCLVIWDGMVAPRDYLDLHSVFQSRGRRVVLVGSAYQTDANFQKPNNSLRVEGRMTDDERKRFRDFLESMGVQMRQSLLDRLSNVDETFLGQLYRELPASRSALQAGLGREVAHAEDFIRRRALATQQSESSSFGTNLGAVLSELGIDLPDTPFGEKREMVAGEQIDEVRQLVGLVMVPGQFGIASPFELLMRTVGRNAGRNLIDILKNIDIFQLREDSLGNPTVEARTALEAQLIVRRTLGGAKSEIEYAKRLLANLRASFVTGTREVDFAVELLRSIGPNGFREEYYRPYFGEIAASLRDLRRAKGLRHARLLLQESTFLREAAKLDAEEGVDVGHSAADKREQLNQAFEACEEALKQMPTGGANRWMKGRILVEMASTCGTLAKIEVDRKARLKLVNEAQSHAWKAFATDSRNHYALDVIAWTARDMLQCGGISAEEELQLIESVTTAFAVANAQEWDTEAVNQLDRRRVEMVDIIFDRTISEKAFDKLLARHSAAGVVVRAYQIAEKDITDESRQAQATQALDWMTQERHRAVVEANAHASFLRFKLWWRARLGFDLNEGERIALPFTREQWQECLNLVANLLSFDDFREHPTLRLIEAIGLFHLGDSNRGFEAFATLSSDQIFVRNRIVRRFLFSDQHGKAKRFSGRVVRLEERDGSLLVQGFARWVPFFVQEVNRSDLRRGDDLDGFGIAFNMLGPIAEFRK